ncbi:SDR family oxidoreductase [Asaia sp. As-1742]|uniref:SDR family oxidoreductase n=1 Tax=Asaia sp. As-1742 TaxID=2608325 RepID=UPI001422DC43|nr:SDR family oxidoreductase [Asaia sp. As-1742]NIE79204.1 SDR family oxidoreductase [Asaia sp. As-1742]
MTIQRTYAIIGGTSGMGFGVARRLVARGDRVLIGGRDRDRLDHAAGVLGERATMRMVDVTDRATLSSFFSDAPPLTGLFTPAASYQTGSFRDASPEIAASPFHSKFWGQYWTVHAALPYLVPTSGIVLVSGAASVRPLGSASYTACNAAIEGLARGLATELAPVRVNCLSPGTIDSELWRARPSSIREAAFSTWKGLTLSGRVALLDEIVDAALFLLDNANMNGTTLYCDGGYALR